ncbi:hypothetical protein BP6252_05971 [Coleophoma cylindrospora]|uniref:Uncharacterized protein n=1 Tax=Coleophoma cylindrospora TaxID=1849047 RepID=A0A3D8RLB4_9HELO|nr:hypothetical protein BP6252_05971 [Coleophoma cylindrospora]
MARLILNSVLLAFFHFTFAQDVTTAEEASQHISISSSGTLLSNPNLTINAVNCTVIGDLSFSGGCDDAASFVSTCPAQWAPDANFSMLPVDFTENWLGIAFDDFHIHIELDVELTPENPTNEIDIHLLGDSGIDIPFSKSGPFSTTFNFDPQIHGWVNSSSPANFSYGFDFVIPDHSAIWIPVVHLDNISTFGFNDSTFTTTGMKSSNPDLQFDFSLAFRPTFSIVADFLTNILSDAITVYADTPNIGVSVSQVDNVTPSCTASDGTQKTFKNLTHVVPSITTDFDFSVAKPVEDFPFGPWNLTTNPLPTQCLAWDTSSTTLIDAASATSDARRITVVLTPLVGFTLFVFLFV